MTKDDEKWKKKMVDVFENNEKSQNEWKETVFENLQKTITDNEKTNEKWEKSLNDTIDQKLDKVINAHDKAIDSFCKLCQRLVGSFALGHAGGKNRTVAFFINAAVKNCNNALVVTAAD